MLLRRGKSRDWQKRNVYALEKERLSIDRSQSIQTEPVDICRTSVFFNVFYFLSIAYFLHMEKKRAVQEHLFTKIKQNKTRQKKTLVNVILAILSIAMLCVTFKLALLYQVQTHSVKIVPELQLALSSPYFFI